MKPIATLKNLLAGSLLLISVLTGCKKDPDPQPIEDIYTWDYSKKSAGDASKIKPDNVTRAANNNQPGNIKGPAQEH